MDAYDGPAGSLHRTVTFRMESGRGLPLESLDKPESFPPKFPHSTETSLCN
jgi:hypothetical protein